MKNYFLFLQNNLKIVIEYKASFLIQAFTMLISNTSFFLIWYFIFDRFGTFSGFNFYDYLILFDTLLFNFCFVHIFFGGYGNIATGATNGTLDNFLLMPKGILSKLLAYGMPSSIFGDLINALLIPLFVPGFTFFMFLKVLYFSLIGSFVFLGFIIITTSLSFFIGSSKEISRALFELILGPGNYPEKIFEGTFLKLIFVTIIPVYYTFYLPFNLVRSFEWQGFIILHLSALFFMGAGYIVFYRGLKRYESGNLMITNI
ncbi:MAG: ABC-2 family transporter protein [Candidatus Gracilibacteria bacterium]|nr:ABC-2 family transporter protein [Candidatus Gracilibacteria bacterium]